MSFSHYIISLNYSLFTLLYNKHDVNLIDVLNDKESYYINKYFPNPIISFYYIESYSIIEYISYKLLYVFRKEKVCKICILYLL